MKYVILSILGAMFTTTAYSQSLAGLWNTGKDNTKVEIKTVDGIFEGTIHSSDNPEAEIGKLLIKEVQKDKNSFIGKLYAVRKGEWVEAEFIPRAAHLDIKISVGFIKKTIQWNLSN